MGYSDLAPGRRTLRRAVEDLVSLGLLRDRGYEGEVFEITHEGYEAIDYLKRHDVKPEDLTGEANA